MKWILDDMVFGFIVAVLSSCDFSAWRSGELVLAEATAQNASQNRSGRREGVLSATSGADGSEISTIITVTVNSAAGQILYNHLRSQANASANLAEHQSIAWALANPEEDSVFVTQDRLAAMLALSELGRSRVCHPYELWEQFLSQRYLTNQQFEDLMNKTACRDQGIPSRPWRLKNT